MTNDIFCVGLTRTELQTLGVLLYSPDGSMCALRGRQPGQPNVRAVLRHSVPYKGAPPLRCHSSYPSGLCSGNRLLTQSIPIVKSENPYRYQDRLKGYRSSRYPVTNAIHTKSYNSWDMFLTPYPRQI